MMMQRVYHYDDMDNQSMVMSKNTNLEHQNSLNISIVLGILKMPGTQRDRGSKFNQRPAGHVGSLNRYGIWSGLDSLHLTNTSPAY